MNDAPLNSTNSFGELLPGTPLPRVEQAAVPADLALIDAQGQLRFTAAGESSLRQISGCDSSPLGLRFLRQAVNAAGGAQSHDRLQQTAEAGAFLHSIRPADAIEGALAAQLYAMHVAGMHNMAQAASATDEGCADLYRKREEAVSVFRAANGGVEVSPRPRSPDRARRARPGACRRRSRGGHVKRERPVAHAKQERKPEREDLDSPQWQCAG